VDLIVLATPVPEILNLLPAGGRLDSRAIVTDVGSTKRHIMRAAAGANVARFIGGHPVAGTERPGLAHAHTDLFERQPWLLVAGSPVDQDALARLEGFFRCLGAEPHRFDADTHDRTLAYVSYLTSI